MIPETITITLPPNLAAAARLDALARGETVEFRCLHYLADSFHHEVGAGHFPDWSSKQVIAWLLKDTPKSRHVREAEALVLHRARKLAEVETEDEGHTATDSFSDALNALTNAYQDADVTEVGTPAESSTA